jgi:hypothetical protein
MNFLESALSYAARGWHVFPLKPRGKFPIIPKAAGGNGYLDATLDAEQIKEWWTKWPNANVGIACGVSNLYVVDNDHGCKNREDFDAWMVRNNLPRTYAVRTGRRTDYAVQLYYSGATEKNQLGKWNLDGCTGEIRSTGGLVMAAGNIHPETGEVYKVLIDAPLAPWPDIFDQSIQRIKTAERAERKPGEKITAGRNMALTREVGQFRHKNPGVSEEKTLAYFQEWNIEDVADPLSMDEVEEVVRKQFRLYADAEVLPEVVFGGSQPKPDKDWREYYHTATDHDNVGPPRFLIEGFLPEQAILGLGAFVGQKKTLAALNIVHSLCSGEPLFDKYKVTRKPARVLYLGPENGLISFSDRVNRIGLRDYLCKTFFYSTMSMEENRPLTALMPGEIEDAVIVIDTAIRFTDGSENDAAMMKEFAKHAFSLIRNKAAAVIMLHHSPKSMTKSHELTLENSFRGTGELSAFLSVAIAMRTQDMDNEYESASLLRFVKQRDFEPKPSSFEVKTSRETCRMTFVDGSAGATVTVGNTANKDGKDDEAVAMMQANRQISNVKMAKLLEAAGIDRSKEWVRLKRLELGIGGLKVGSNPIERKE